MNDFACFPWHVLGFTLQPGAGGGKQPLCWMIPLAQGSGKEVQRIVRGGTVTQIVVTICFSSVDIAIWARFPQLPLLSAERSSSNLLPRNLSKIDWMTCTLQYKASAAGRWKATDPSQITLKYGLIDISGIIFFVQRKEETKVILAWHLMAHLSTTKHFVTHTCGTSVNHKTFY